MKSDDAKNCVYCTSPDIKAHTIVRRELAWAFPTNIPITPGHTLVVPTRHVGKIADLTKEEKIAILELAEEIKQALKIASGAIGFNQAWNEGNEAGQAVPHFHLHIVPRKPGDAGIAEYEPRKFLYRPGSRETTPEDELRAVAKKIAEVL